MAIVANVYIDDLKKTGDYREAPMTHHRYGLSFTRSGYGARIPTQHLVRIAKRWRRVYCCIFGNAGTCYVTTGPNKDWIVVN